MYCYCYCSCIKCDPFARSSSPCTAIDFDFDGIEEFDFDVEEFDNDCIEPDGIEDYKAGSIHPAYFMDDYDPV